MKRYKITNQLKTVIRNNPFGINNLSKLAGFNVKNFYRGNKSINEVHLDKLKYLLGINPTLEIYEQDYSKNFGYIIPNIKKLEKGQELAEFCGIMLGDGYFHKGGIKIAFDKRDVNYMDYVGNLFKRLFGVKLRPQIIKTTNQGYLYFYSKKLADDLTSFEMVQGDKIKNNVGIPEWIKENEIYSKRLVRGLIDTDGCVYICKRERQRYVKFTNFNRRLLLEFKDLVLKLGYHFANANKQNVCLYRKDEVIKFINDIKPVRAGMGLSYSLF